MSKKKILVVDDSQSVRQQVGVALSQAGFEIVEAVDGQEGLKRIGSDAGLAMVIADINMPNMNGLEMLERARPQIEAGLPILMLTALGEPKLVKRAKLAGAKGWIVKPFKADQLVASVKKLAR